MCAKVSSAFFKTKIAFFLCSVYKSFIVSKIECLELLHMFNMLVCWSGESLFILLLKYKSWLQMFHCGYSERF